MIKPIQELIKRLKELDYKYYGYELVTLKFISRDDAELVISALEKQIPKKPEYDCYKHLYICPHCGEYIVTYNQEFPYEIKCGGRLEW